VGVEQEVLVGLEVRVLLGDGEQGLQRAGQRVLGLRPRLRALRGDGATAGLDRAWNRSIQRR
jgi:hypothetical protein